MSGEELSITGAALTTLNNTDVLTGSGDNATLTLVSDTAVVNVAPTLIGVETLDVTAYAAVTLGGAKSLVLPVSITQTALLLSR